MHTVPSEREQERENDESCHRKKTPERASSGGYSCLLSEREREQVLGLTVVYQARERERERDRERERENNGRKF